MKKILSIILAAAAAFTMSTAVFAETETAQAKTEPATFSFDTDASMKYLHTFGHASDTGLTYELSDAGAVSGRCIKISESFTSPVSNQYGGIYIDAADLGLENFSGYTMKISLKVSDEAAKKTEVILAFSDGEQWLTENVLTSNAGKWQEAKITVPVNVVNTKLGISIPITDSFTGDVVYIDNIILTDNYGKAVANVGDIDTSLAEAPNTAMSVLTTILFILLIIVVILGVGFVAMKFFRRFR